MVVSRTVFARFLGAHGGLPWLLCLVLLGMQASGAQAVPLTATPDEGSTTSGRAPSRAAGGGQERARELSTGNRNLDMLLDLQGRPGEAAHAASRPASGGVKVPLPNTNLSGGVLTRVQTGPASAPAQTDVLMGPMSSDLRAKPSAPDPTEKRQWRVQSQGVGSVDTGSGDSMRAPGAVGSYEEPATLRMMRETIEWLRENRWAVLGTMLGLTALGGLIKAYARRP